MATLRIVRNSEPNNRFSKYKIIADGNKIGEIANGATEQFDLPEGTHTIRATINWCSSQDIQVVLREDKAQTLYLSRFKMGRYLTYIVWGILALHLLASSVFKFPYLIYLMILPFFLMLYYFTIGRKNYLQISDQFNI